MPESRPSRRHTSASSPGAARGTWKRRTSPRRCTPLGSAQANQLPPRSPLHWRRSHAPPQRAAGSQDQARASPRQTRVTKGPRRKAATADAPAGRPTALAAAVSHPHRAPHSHASHSHASFAHGSRPRSLANARFAAATSDMDGASAHTDDARHGRERELHERRRRRGDGETTRGARPAARTGERGARASARRRARTDAIALTWR